MASAVDPDAVPSVDRRSRLWPELSRAYAQQRDWLGSLGALRTGAAISEESMRSHPLARSLASDLVTHGGRLNERESRALATRLGVTAKHGCLGRSPTDSGRRPIGPSWWDAATRSCARRRAVSGRVASCANLERLICRCESAAMLVNTVNAVPAVEL